MFIPTADTANAAHDVLAYWAPVIGTASIILLGISLPALKWLWDLKNNHVHTIESNSIDLLLGQQKQTDVMNRQTEVLVEIKTILAERR